MSFTEYAIIGIIVTLIGFAAGSAYQESKKPEFSLKKDEWVCSKKETRT